MCFHVFIHIGALLLSEDVSCVNGVEVYSAHFRGVKRDTVVAVFLFFMFAFRQLAAVHNSSRCIYRTNTCVLSFGENIT